jgi:hypothetical protein
MVVLSFLSSSTSFVSGLVVNVVEPVFTIGLFSSTNV